MSCRVARVSAAVYLVIREGQLVLRGTPRQKWVVSQDVLVCFSKSDAYSGSQHVRCVFFWCKTE